MTLRAEQARLGGIGGRWRGIVRTSMGQAYAEGAA